MKPPSTARTAGRSGGCGGACDASPLSCFLFRPRKRLEKRKKRSHTNVFNASVIRTSTSLEQTAHVCFQSRKRVHTRLSERNRTQGHTRRNRGCFGWGWYHYPQSVPHVSETLRGQVSERQTLPLLGLGWVYFRRTQKACGTAMRLCVSLFRGVAAPLGCVIFFRFCRNCGLYTLRSELSARARRGWYHYPRRALRAVETPDGRLSKRLICRFLVSPIYICESPRRALPICFGTADFLFAGRKFFLNFRIPFVSPDGQAVVPFPAVFLSGAFQRFSLRLQEQNKVSLVRSVYLFLGVIHG